MKVSLLHGYGVFHLNNIFRWGLTFQTTASWRVPNFNKEAE